MSRPRVKIKVRKGKGRNSPATIKARIMTKPYIGGEAAREKARADSLQKELDSLKCQIKVIIKEQE